MKSYTPGISNVHSLRRTHAKILSTQQLSHSIGNTASLEYHTFARFLLGCFISCVILTEKIWFCYFASNFEDLSLKTGFHCVVPRDPPASAPPSPKCWGWRWAPHLANFKWLKKSHPLLLCGEWVPLCSHAEGQRTTSFLLLYDSGIVHIVSSGGTFACRATSWPLSDFKRKNLTRQIFWMYPSVCLAVLGNL